MPQWIKTTITLPSDRIHHPVKFNDGGYGIYFWDAPKNRWKSEMGWNTAIAEADEVVEWLDEDSPDEPVFSLEDMIKTWDAGSESSFTHLSCGYGDREKYFKEKYNIDLPNRDLQ